MGAKPWEDEAAQLVIMANNGHRKLENERFSLALEDFKPNYEVARVLAEYSGILSSLSDLHVSQAKASPEISEQLKDLHGGLCELAQTIQERLSRHHKQLVSLRVKGGAGEQGADRAPNEDLQVTKGKEPEVVGDREPWPVGDKGPGPVHDKGPGPGGERGEEGSGAAGGETPESEPAGDKARRILWYNWFFVACLIVFVQTRLPPRGLGIRSWPSAKAVPVANALVNRAFKAYGASAFYLYDAYSAIQYLLSGPAQLQAKAPEMAEKAFARFSSEYTHLFPRGETERFYLPVISIAGLTKSSCVDVCYAIGLREVGARLRGVPLQRVHDEVGMCMAVQAPLMAEVLLKSEPLSPLVLDPSSAATFDSLPPESFAILAMAHNLGI